MGLKVREDPLEDRVDETIGLKSLITRAPVFLGTREIKALLNLESCKVLSWKVRNFLTSTNCFLAKQQTN